MIERPCQPGDVFTRTFKYGGQRHWVVAFPAYTRAGKLRVISYESGAIHTTWWTPEGQQLTYRPYRLIRPIQLPPRGWTWDEVHGKAVAA